VVTTSTVERRSYIGPDNEKQTDRDFDLNLLSARINQTVRDEKKAVG
jgi:hypothetical protein